MRARLLQVTRGPVRKGTCKVQWEAQEGKEGASRSRDRGGEGVPLPPLERQYQARNGTSRFTGAVPNPRGNRRIMLIGSVNARHLATLSVSCGHCISVQPCKPLARRRLQTRSRSTTTMSPSATGGPTLTPPGPTPCALGARATHPGRILDFPLHLSETRGAKT
jgi:hypothetical protein